MTMPNNRHSPLTSESGQAAVLVATLLFLAFLAFAALAIDGSMTYLVRRDLQNVADSAALAACRVIAGNDTTTTPLAAAENSITTHLGEFAAYAGDNPPATNIGAGGGLVKGIEINTQDVRVAVMRRVPTVLTQFVGRGDSFINAHAHCDSRAGGGLLPIAVQRYDGGTGGTMTDYVARKSIPVYPTDSIMQNPPWDGRYGAFYPMVPCGNPGAPACPGGVNYVASDGAVGDSNTGPEVLLVGASADTNNNVASMRDLVLLDIRNVASQNALEYYNGANSQADAAKYLSREWIRQHGYPGPYPLPGSQVAILDGASVDYTEHAMILDANYQVGDPVAVIVYDGFVWQRPDFAVTFKPQCAGCSGVDVGYPVDSSTARVYTVRIDQAGPASAGWSSPINFSGQLVFNNGPLPAGSHVVLDGVGELTAPGYSFAAPNVTSTGWGGTVRIWSTNAITDAKYLTGIDVIISSDQGQVHGPDPALSTRVQYGYWNGFNINIDYIARSNDGQLFLRQAGSYQANLVTYGVGTAFPNGPGTCNNVPVAASVFLGGTPLAWDTFFSSPASTSIDIKKDNAKTANLALGVLAGAPIGSGYTLHLTVGIPPATCNGITIPVHSVDIPFDIQPPAPTATPDKFVIIQGYAIFRISRYDANDVWGYAISPLYDSYDKITFGLRPRLVPW